jgi:hypothetical protein
MAKMTHRIPNSLMVFPELFWWKFINFTESKWLHCEEMNSQ